MSQYQFKLPDIGEGVTEGEIVGWLVNEGDAVTENQDMVEIMTDKATVTIGAPKTGRIAQLRGKQGDVVPVGEVLVVLDVGGDDTAAPTSEVQKQPREEAPKRAPQPESRPEPGAGVQRPARDATEPPAERSSSVSERQHGAARDQQEGPAATAVGDLRDALPGMSVERGRQPEREGKPSNGYFSDKPLAAPATRRLARELGVDLKQVEPTGPGGRVTREDVEQFRGHGAQAKPKAEAPVPDPHARAAEAKAPPGVERIPRAPESEEERVPLRGLRKRIFENMARSKHTAAHFTYVDECDATGLRALRERLAPYAEKAGTKLSFLPIIVKATIAALKKHPELNCLVDDESRELVLRKNFDIGIAVATEGGLTVAALRDADRLSILDTAREINRLAQAARENKLRKEELGGTSFTITSLGKLGGLFATPIVNYPEVAILGVHELKRRPVVKGDQIVIGEVMLLSLSFDHRVIDGHIGAAFAQEIIGLLENPDRLFAELT